MASRLPSSSARRSRTVPSGSASRTRSLPSARAGGGEPPRLEAQARLLYAHFAPFDELLRTVREGGEPPSQTQVKAVDRGSHTVTLAIGDFDAVTLDYTKDVTGNAQ